MKDGKGGCRLGVSGFRSGKEGGSGPQQGYTRRTTRREERRRRGGSIRVLIDHGCRVGFRGQEGGEGCRLSRRWCLSPPLRPSQHMLSKWGGWKRYAIAQATLRHDSPEVMCSQRFRFRCTSEGDARSPHSNFLFISVAPHSAVSATADIFLHHTATDGCNNVRPGGRGVIFWCGVAQKVRRAHR